ncbi:uncharacterized protein MKZ38_000006 [Zalerion maritima]|uniref:Uncharacterized protein n=1 Tax=Zalerion maritima TaxID=339359 RepID=A0AAD5WMS0_9PEZI|nr:uncharacterized protein MKZ38_000006 [Zalerion maritima]
MSHSDQSDDEEAYRGLPDLLASVRRSPAASRPPGSSRPAVPVSQPSPSPVPRRVTFVLPRPRTPPPLAEGPGARVTRSRTRVVERFARGQAALSIDATLAAARSPPPAAPAPSPSPARPRGRIDRVLQDLATGSSGSARLPSSPLSPRTSRQSSLVQQTSPGLFSQGSSRRSSLASSSSLIPLSQPPQRTVAVFGVEMPLRHDAVQAFQLGILPPRLSSSLVKRTRFEPVSNFVYKNILRYFQFGLFRDPPLNCVYMAMYVDLDVFETLPKTTSLAPVLRRRVNRPVAIPIPCGGFLGQIMGGLCSSLRFHRWQALAVQLKGVVNKNPCEHCASGWASHSWGWKPDAFVCYMFPFFECVSVPGYAGDRCGNCLWLGEVCTAEDEGLKKYMLASDSDPPCNGYAPYEKFRIEKLSSDTVWEQDIKHWEDYFEAILGGPDLSEVMNVLNLGAEDVPGLTRPPVQPVQGSGSSGARGRGGGRGRAPRGSSGGGAAASQAPARREGLRSRKE